MVVNNGGNLSIAYFIAYLNLIIQAKQCSVICAQQYMLEKFFKGNPNHFGPVTYQSFIQATGEINK
ncbi:hypothetical protein MHH33_02045 [Paenisporosarcina sp. FSL H8-0542]|uniref:hypothetical protein n=1 Tax=Paenisporosarcina sp. FSL H8-0542 TaxID=2921401 RepID=UPI0031599A4F